MTQAFYEHVYLKYQVFNSLFLTLPFGDILQTGTLLPLLSMEAAKKLEAGKSPSEIIEVFLDEHVQTSEEARRNDVLFAFIKYVERQVVLFDAIEDAAFSRVHKLSGRGSLPDLFNRVDSRAKSEALAEKLRNFSLRVVLTAHPTQFYPGRILSIISDLDNAIRANDVSGVNEILLQLGKTPMVQNEKPTPYIEAVRLIWYLENVFFDAIGNLLEDLKEGIAEEDEDSLSMEDLVRVGFWPGGDRDGNPFVTSETTLDVAKRLRRTVLLCYFRESRKVIRRLTFKHVYHKIQEVSSKLNNGIADPELGYLHADELLSDLGEIREELTRQGLDDFLKYINGFINRVRIFGFHFATIDIRQDSSAHDDLIDWIADQAGWEDWKAMPEAQKLEHLAGKKPEYNEDQIGDPIQKDVFDSMRIMQEIVQMNGDRACQRYIISNTQSLLHILQVFYFMQWTLDETPFDVVPLFETIDDLAAAPGIMDSLYKDGPYSEHLHQRGNIQPVMLGFSDGTKDGGYMRANWSIFRAKEEITLVSRQHGIQVVFFDGRGGPPARGGGKSHRFYASLGSSIEDREVQMTVQGQTISSNFGTVSSARYNLEQLFTAGLENSLFKGDIREVDQDDREILSEIAEISYESYRDFKNDPEFLPYLEQLGTLPYYGMTNIGSRPVKRSGSKQLTLKSLRAIPFVSSWNQMKQNVPGFYGLGTALQRFKDRGELQKIRDLYANTLFFRTLIDNSMMSLSKSYFPLTQYLEDHPKFGRIWKRIHEEYSLTKSLLLEITGQKDLMEHSPNGRDSVRLREQLVLPVLVIQQYALQKSRELEAAGLQKEAGVYHTMVMRTMFAIINAGRNSA